MRGKSDRTLPNVLCSWMMLLFASIGVIVFAGLGATILSFQFSRENPDSPYWLIGGMLLALAAVFARAVMLAASTRNRARLDNPVPIHRRHACHYDLDRGDLLRHGGNVRLTYRRGVRRWDDHYDRY